MAMTTPGDIWVPDVVGELAVAQVFEKVALLQTGFIGDARATAIRDGAGTAVLFPYIENTTTNRGVQANARTGSAVTPDEMTITYESASIVDKIVSYETDEKARRMIAQMADPNAYMAGVVQKKMAAHIQQALITAGAAGSQIYTDPANKISIQGLKKAMITSWGDKAFEERPLIVTHSHVQFDFDTSTEVIQSGVYGTPGIDQIEVRYCAGMYFVTIDQIPSSNSVYSNLILRQGALELWMDPRGQGSGEQRVAGTTAYISDWWFEYATHISKNDPCGVIVYKVAASMDS